MNRSLGLRGGLAAAGVLALALAGCSSSGGGGSSAAGSSAPGGSGTASSSAGGGSGSVNVDIGTGKPIKLKTGHLKVGVFMIGMSNQWQQNFAKSAVNAAKSAGYSATVIDSNFDIAKRLNQIQNAATNHMFDAIVFDPVDGDQECNAVTKTLPAANILPVVSVGAICGRDVKSDLNQLWSPGTLTFVGGDATLPYYFAWVDATAKANPGPQQVAVVVGPQLAPFTKAAVAGINETAAKYPDFHIADYLYTDYTTPSGYTATLTYLKSHPKTTLIMSVYSPDLTRGIVQALKATGKDGKIPVSDLGGSQYSVEQIKAGTVQLTLPYVPLTESARSVQAIVAAQTGKPVPHYISPFPPGLGTATAPYVVTKENVATFKPQF